MSRTLDHFFRGQVAFSGGAARPAGQPASGQRCDGQRDDEYEPAWTHDPSWTSLKQQLADLKEPVRLLELCAGASTAAYALHLLIGKDKVSLAGAYDLDIECAKVARAVHGQLAPGHKFGSYEGDVMRTAIESFPYADLLVAGPPCPPFSKLGQRKTFEDSRAAPFWRIIDIIHHQASIGQLKGFLLENVEGIAQKVKGPAKHHCRSSKQSCLMVCQKDGQSRTSSSIRKALVCLNQDHVCT